MFFKFEYSFVIIFVDRNPAAVEFDCDFFAFSEKKLTITFMIPPMADMAGPYEQTTWLKYYNGRFLGHKYRKLFCKMIPRSSGQKVKR